MTRLLCLALLVLGGCAKPPNPHLPVVRPNLSYVYSDEHRLCAVLSYGGGEWALRNIWRMRPDGRCYGDDEPGGPTWIFHDLPWPLDISVEDRP